MLQSRHRQLKSRQPSMVNRFKTLRQMRKMENKYNKINSTYETVVDKNAKLLAGDKKENSMLLQELDGKERNLQAQEDKLKVLERDLDSRKIDLEKVKVSRQA